MLDKLKASFPPEKVSWRVGVTSGDKKSGLPLAYIDARDVMDRLDEVCGPDNWQANYSHTKPSICNIGIRINDEWIWKANGAGDTDVEADKGAISDAFKRAAVLWGIGRYLYDVKAPWVAIEPHGRSYKIKQSEMPKLIACLPSERAKLEQSFKTIRQNLLNAPHEAALENVWSDSESERKELPPEGQAALLDIYHQKKAQAA